MVKVDATRFATRLLHPRNLGIITTVDRSVKANAATMAWITPVSFDPPMVAVSIAPSRYTSILIDDVKEFVVNIPTSDLLDKAFLFGTKSGKTVDKIELAKVTLRPAKIVKPPLIDECIAHLECQLSDRMEVGDHILYIGRVLAADADESIYRDEKFDPGRGKLLLHIGGEYFTTTSNEVMKPSK